MLEDFFAQIFLARGQNSQHLILGDFLFLARAAYSAHARAQNKKKISELQIGTVQFLQNTLDFKIVGGSIFWAKNLLIKKKKTPNFDFGLGFPHDLNCKIWNFS